MKKNWPMFVAINVVGILVGTIVGAGAAYLFGSTFDAQLIINCFLVTAAICIFGSFALWPNIWQKKP